MYEVEGVWLKTTHERVVLHLIKKKEKKGSREGTLYEEFRKSTGMSIEHMKYRNIAFQLFFMLNKGIPTLIC